MQKITKQIWALTVVQLGVVTVGVGSQVPLWSQTICVGGFLMCLTIAACCTIGDYTR